MSYIVHGERSSCTLSRRNFGLNLGVKVGAMPKHSDCFCNNESAQKAKDLGVHVFSSPCNRLFCLVKNIGADTEFFGFITPIHDQVLQRLFWYKPRRISSNGVNHPFLFIKAVLYLLVVGAHLGSKF